MKNGKASTPPMTVITIAQGFNIEAVCRLPRISSAQLHKQTKLRDVEKKGGGISEEIQGAESRVRFIATENKFLRNLDIL